MSAHASRIAVVVLLSVLAAYCLMRAAEWVRHDVNPGWPWHGVTGTAAAAGITHTNLASASEMQQLLQRRLLIPVEGVDRNRLRDNFNEMRGGTHRHDALDIMAPRGTPVLAVDAGRIAKLERGGPGGITIYEYDPGKQYAYYYAHLDHYAIGLREGATVRRGDVIGYVGTSGNASPGAPHLHFTILKLASGGRLWSGEALNPYPFLVESTP
ncbi:MAG TPA: M23 family metallopeptidase [Usitatibacter sp.]|jgi:murein DD-endopeptidase MepM/ murein hydrolase activator NlpD